MECINISSLALLIFISSPKYPKSAACCPPVACHFTPALLTDIYANLIGSFGSFLLPILVAKDDLMPPQKLYSSSRMVSVNKLSVIRIHILSMRDGVNHKMGGLMVVWI